MIARQNLIGKVEHRVSREEAVRIRKVPVKRLSDAAADCFFISSLDSLQKFQKIPEELLAYEVIVDQTVVLLSRIFSIDPDKGA